MESIAISAPKQIFGALIDDVDDLYDRLFDNTIPFETKLADILSWLINLSRAVSETNCMAPKEILVSTVLMTEYDGISIDVSEIILFKTYFEKNREVIDDLVAQKIETLNESPQMIEKIKRNFSCIIADEIGHLMSFIDQCAEAGDAAAMEYYAAMI